LLESNIILYLLNKKQKCTFMSNKERKQLSVTTQTNEKLDELRAKFWLAKKIRPSADTIIDYLVEKELLEMNKTEKQKEK